MKHILIKRCNECPHLSHTGAFTEGGAKPCCNHSEVVENKGDSCFDRIIPYKRQYYDGVHYSYAPKRIPRWCPLYNDNTTDLCNTIDELLKVIDVCSKSLRTYGRYPITEKYIKIATDEALEMKTKNILL